MRLVADQIRPYISQTYIVLGTDGFGRSDTRENLRRFFEVDRFHVAIAALKGLSDEGKLDKAVVQEAIEKYRIDVSASAPWLC